MPEIAEREPKVSSVGFVHVCSPSRGCSLCIWPASRCRSPQDSLTLWWSVRWRKWSSLPRLETRTKESDTDASIEVANLSAQ